jgi:hypothetical protein
LEDIVSNSTNDRAVQALIDDGWAGEGDTLITDYGLANGVALVLRVVRDDMLAARNAGNLDDITDVAHWLGSRVMELTGQPTSPGDTTD